MPIESVLSIQDEVLLITSGRSDIKMSDTNLMELMLQDDNLLQQKRIYIGKIENIYSGSVSFKCYGKPNLKSSYTVIFRPSRLQLRYQYRALELLNEVMPHVQKFLFPDDIGRKSLPSSPIR